MGSSGTSSGVGQAASAAGRVVSRRCPGWAAATAWAQRTRAAHAAGALRRHAQGGGGSAVGPPRPAGCRPRRRRRLRPRRSRTPPAPAAAGAAPDRRPRRVHARGCGHASPAPRRPRRTDPTGAERLGQHERRGRDDGAAGEVVEELQGDGRAPHERLVRPDVGEVAHPDPPSVERCRHRLGGPPVVASTVAGTPTQRDVGVLTAPQRHRSVEPVERHRGRQLQVEVRETVALDSKARREPDAPPRGCKPILRLTSPSSTTIDRRSSPRAAGASSVRSAPRRSVNASVTRTSPNGARISVTSTPVSGS